MSNTSNLVGEADHTQLLSENIGQLYLNKRHSDVTFIVESQEIRAHKVILETRSDYFRALLFEEMHECQQNPIELKETKAPIFLNVLKYIYTGRVKFIGLKEDVLLDILRLSRCYKIMDLETATSSYLKTIIDIKNVCTIYDTSYLYQPSSLMDACLTFMDRHALEIAQHESFLLLSAPALKFAVSRDSFCAPEIDIFRAVWKWKTQNVPEDGDNDDVMDEILDAVRFILMSVPDLLNIVRPSKLLSPDDILDVVKSQTKCRDVDLNYRGFLIPEENVASPDHNSQVLHGKTSESTVVHGITQKCYTVKGYARHLIDDHYGQGILIKLGMPCIINHIKMLLWDGDNRSYSYYIEASMDMKEWIRLIDYTEYLCRSWQLVYFPVRIARYIRIIGTRHTMPDTNFKSYTAAFHIISFSCMFTMDQFSIDNGIIVPCVNVADEARGAVVLEDGYNSRNALINGDTKQYDTESGYTYHQIDQREAIVIQLAQPYAIDSMRLLLWDIDDRTYSYCIEVSVDQHNWEMVVDKSEELCKSWQVVRFSRRLVTFIRIVGTHNSANTCFHCVHFECPSQDDREGIHELTMGDGEFVHSGSNDIHGSYRDGVSNDINDSDAADDDVI